MGLVELFGVASMPVIKVLLITAVGLLLALDNVNLLGKDARIQVNHVTPLTLNEVFSSFFLFFICLLYLHILLTAVFHLYDSLCIMCSILHWWVAIWRTRLLLRMLFYCEY